MITITVYENSIKQSGKSCGVCGEGNSREMTIVFKDDWLSYSKRIIFYDARGKSPVCILLTDANRQTDNDGETYIIRIPSEPLKYSGEIEYVVQGYTTLDDNSTAVAKSECGYMTVSYAPPETEYDIPADITPDKAAQLQVAIETAGSNAKKYTDSKSEEINKRVDALNKNLEDAEASIRRDTSAALAEKADTSEVSAALEKKADKGEVPKRLSELTDDVGFVKEENFQKFQQEVGNTETETYKALEKKADKSEMSAALAEKANTNDVSAALAEKAEKEEIPMKVSVLENDAGYMKEEEYPNNIYLIGNVSSLEELQTLSNQNNTIFKKNSGAVVGISADIQGQLELTIPGGPAVIENIDIHMGSYMIASLYGWGIFSRNVSSELAQKADNDDVDEKLAEISNQIQELSKSLENLKSLNFVLYDDSGTELIDTEKLWKVKSVGYAAYGTHSNAKYWEVYNSNANINRLSGETAKLYSSSKYSQQYEYVQNVVVSYVDYANNRLFFSSEIPALNTRDNYYYLLFKNSVLSVPELQILSPDTENLYEIDTTATESGDGYVVKSKGVDFSALKKNNVYLALNDNTVKCLACNGYLGTVNEYTPLGNNLVDVKVQDEQYVDVVQKYPDEKLYLYINKDKYKYDATQNTVKTGPGGNPVEIDGDVTIEEPDVPL